MRALFGFLKSSIWPKWNLESGPASSFEGPAPAECRVGISFLEMLG